MGISQASGDNVMLWAYDLGGLVSLTRTSYLNTAANQVHAFTATVLLNGRGVISGCK